MKKLKTALIGLGNPIVGDDGIGIKVVEYIKDTFSLPENIKIIADVSLAGIGLVELFRGFDEIILVDSIQTNKYPKGTVVYLQPKNFADAIHISDYHSMDFYTALEYCNQMYEDIPKDIKILGIEIFNAMEFSDHLSLELQKKFEEIVDKVYKFILQENNERMKLNIL